MSCSASKSVTSCPIFTRSPAHDSPAGPPPTIATFSPEGGLGVGGGRVLFWSSQSAANRSRYPTATGFCFTPIIHTFSHCSSCGHTRPHTAGRALSSLRILAASEKFSSAIAWMNCGILTRTGHPSIHFGFLHWIHLLLLRQPFQW